MPLWGDIIYYGRRTGVDGAIWAFDTATREDRLVTAGARPRLSPDGTRMLFLRDNEPFANRGNVYVRELATGEERRIFSTVDNTVTKGAAFGVNSNEVLFDSGCGIFRLILNPAGPEVPSLVLGGHCEEDGPAVHPGSSLMVFHHLPTGDLGLTDYGGGNKQYFPASPADEIWPSFSPDGRWIVASAGELDPEPGGPANLIKIRSDGSEFTWLTTFADAATQLASGGVWQTNGVILAAGSVEGKNGLYLAGSNGEGIIGQIQVSEGDPIDFVGGVVETPEAPDTELPTLMAPERVTADCGNVEGAVVDFTVTAQDNSGAVTVECLPASGSQFPLGTTWVECSARDAAGNVALGGFPVTVYNTSTAPDPSLASISPSRVPAEEATLVTVRGINFLEVDQVRINGQPLSDSIWVSAEEIMGRTPKLPPGSYEIELYRCNDAFARLTDALESAAGVPVIRALDGGEVYAEGGTVTVYGENLTAETEIRVGFEAPDGTANLLRNVAVSADGTSLTARLPSLPPGTLFGSRDLIARDARGQSILHSAVSYAPAPLVTDPQVLALRRLSAAAVDPTRISYRAGMPVGLSTRVPAVGDTAGSQAFSFLRSYKELFRIQNPELEITSVRVDEGPVRQVKFGQQFRGLPVFASQAVVTLADDQVFGMAGEMAPSDRLAGANLPENPRLAAEQAEAIARAELNRPEAPLQRPSTLEVFDPNLLGMPGPPVCAWRVWLASHPVELFVDAETGLIVFRNEQEATDGGLESFDFDLQDAENEANASSNNCFVFSDDVTIGDEDSFDDDFNGDPDAVGAWFFGRDTYLFFHDNFGWHSWDNDEAQLEIFIRTSINAATLGSWSNGCDLIQIAAGQVDYELIVHEYTHGIIQSGSGSGLVYCGQSGALNESFADLMAVVADREKGAQNWFVFEDRTGAPNSPSRDISNPPNPAVNSPGFDTIAAYNTNVARFPPSVDNGGVHFFSGIPNKTGFLMSEGGTFNRVPVRGMGLRKMRDLKFEALVRLPSNASFQVARDFEVNTARAWMEKKERGFVWEDVCTVRNAWFAVGVGFGDINCDGVEDSKDTDGDGVVDLLDNCRLVANPNQADGDTDGIGDICDNCPATFNPKQENLDGDSLGDACDPDRDGDGCPNVGPGADAHPDDPNEVIGRYASVCCNPRNGEVTGFAGIDTDGDGDRNCFDSDDDNDGIPDSQDTCPVHRDGGCTVLRDCSCVRNDWWRTCLGGGCVTLQARVTQVINPDPTRNILVDEIQISAQSLYLRPSAGNTVAGLAAAVAGRRAGLQPQATTAPDLRRIELWTRPTATEPARLVTIVGEYDASRVPLDQVTSGTLLEVALAPDGEIRSMGATWTAGSPPAAATLDSDQDGLPDGWENRYGLNPLNAEDAGQDLDQDEVSTLDEYRSGTDPANGSSQFKIESVERGAESALIAFRSVPGRSYQAEWTPSLQAPSWVVASSTLAAQSELSTLSAVGDGPHGFFRIRLLPE